MKFRLKKMATGLICLLWVITFPAICAAEEAKVEEVPGTIKGQILREDRTPFTPGFVAFFESDNLDPMDYGQTRRSPKMISFLDEKGHFQTNLMAPGSYFVGAMERSRWRGGPPVKGEKRFSAFTEKGEYLIVSLKDGENIDIGSVVVKEPELGKDLLTFFTIEGRLLDKDGKGVADSVVVVKKDYNFPKAEFISGKSSFNGYYSLKLPPGKYYLIARETVEGSMRPKPDSIYGELGHTAPIGIGGKSAEPAVYLTGLAGQEYKDVDILMFKVPVPEVKRKETEDLVRANKYSKEDLAENLPLRKNKSDKGAVQSDVKAAGEEKDGKKPGEMKSGKK